MIEREFNCRWDVICRLVVGLTDNATLNVGLGVDLGGNIGLGDNVDLRFALFCLIHQLSK